MKALIATLGLLTRIPMPSVGMTPARAMLWWFVPVGAVVGGCAVGVWVLLGGADHSLLASVCAVLASLAASGGLHMDGLMDSCDALGSNARRERALEIMKDSRVGAFGAMGLVACLLIRVAAVADLSTTAGVRAILLSAMVARLMQVVVSWRYRYARSEPGMATTFFAHARGTHVWIGMGWLAAGILALPGAAASTGVCGVACLVGGLFAAHASRRLGGQTGDTLGAVSEITEMAALVGFALWMGRG